MIIGFLHPILVEYKQKGLVAVMKTLICHFGINSALTKHLERK